VLKIMPEIALDEAGNTGADLLSSQQPIFVLASVSLSRDEADEILAGIRTPQAREMKFKQLKKSEAGQRRVIQCISSSKLTGDNVKITVVHKRFMIVAKVVDLLFETVVHRDGIDLHKDGANIALSNMHFYCMPTFCGEEWAETFLRRFVDMIRWRTPKSVQRFFDAARTLHEISKDRGYAELLAPILASEQIIGHILANSDKNSLDPAIPAFVEHCVFWGERFGEAFDLVHDPSKAIFQEKETLEGLMSRGEQEFLIGYDRRKFIFPLRATGIHFGCSEEDPRLQVADIVAGASSYWVKGCISPPVNQVFWKQIGELNMSRFDLGAIWPTPHVTPSKLGTDYDGGINATDHMAQFLANRGVRRSGINIKAPNTGPQADG
jgi:uncharacterized protein DUF3800